MEWTIEHDMLFCREVIAFDLYQYKPGSRKSQQYWGALIDSWPEIVERQNKGTSKAICGERNKDMRASGVEVERTKLDDLLLDIHERQQQAEAEAAEASEANNKKLDKLTKKDRK